MTSRAIPCSCGFKYRDGSECKAWIVEPEAAVQGVRFTREQAEAVAQLLNGMEETLTNAGQFTLHITVRRYATK